MLWNKFRLTEGCKSAANNFILSHMKENGWTEASIPAPKCFIRTSSFLSTNTAIKTRTLTLVPRSSQIPSTDSNILNIKNIKKIHRVQLIFSSPLLMMEFLSSALSVWPCCFEGLLFDRLSLSWGSLDIAPGLDSGCSLHAFQKLCCCGLCVLSGGTWVQPVLSVTRLTLPD